MTSYNISEEQVYQSVAGARVSTAISVAIAEADRMANGGANMTVVKTKRFGICIYNDFQLTVAKDEIIEQIYNTDGGFIIGQVA